MENTAQALNASDLSANPNFYYRRLVDWISDDPTDLFGILGGPEGILRATSVHIETWLGALRGTYPATA